MRKIHKRSVLLWTPALCLIAFAVAPVRAEPPNPRKPPSESIEKLQNVFRKMADSLWIENDHAWHAGRHDVCIEICRLITEIDPTFVDAYSNGAWLLFSAGRESEAVAMYRRGIAANPKSHELLLDFGMYYYRKKDYSNAEAYFAEAVRNSAPAPVWKMLAHAREKLGKLGEALAAWDKVKEMEPNDPAITPNVQRIRDEIARREGSKGAE